MPSLIVSFNGILLNKNPTSRLAIYNELSQVIISLAKLKESFIENSLRASGSSIGIKNLAKWYPGVFIADRVGLNFGKLSATVLQILGLP